MIYSVIYKFHVQKKPVSFKHVIPSITTVNEEYSQSQQSVIFSKVQENSMNDEREFPFSLDYPVAGMLQMGRDGPAEFSEELLVEGFVGSASAGCPVCWADSHTVTFNVLL